MPSGPGERADPLRTTKLTPTPRSSQQLNQLLLPEITFTTQAQVTWTRHRTTPALRRSSNHYPLAPTRPSLARERPCPTDSPGTMRASSSRPTNAAFTSLRISSQLRSGSCKTTSSWRASLVGDQAPLVSHGGSQISTQQSKEVPYPSVVT